jgi:hypothetical protein
VPAPRQQQQEEEKEEEDNEMEDMEEGEEETRRIYGPYTIDFVAKLGKEIYYGDAFRSDNSDVNRLYRNLL